MLESAAAALDRLPADDSGTGAHQVVTTPVSLTDFGLPPPVCAGNLGSLQQKQWRRPLQCLRSVVGSGGCSGASSRAQQLHYLAPESLACPICRLSGVSVCRPESYITREQVGWPRATRLCQAHPPTLTRPLSLSLSLSLAPSHSLAVRQSAGELASPVPVNWFSRAHECRI